ncbi:hypothetical protein ACQPYH_28715 [Kribbella sp. CA-245084]|uniref:hypothetical protein n=1 Tax=Kribbella sp. CA-245084 TaxID=3239940 RepID=UPI003D944A3A
MDGTFAPLQVSTGWLDGHAPSGWDRAVLEVQTAFVSDRFWLAWWKTLPDPDDIFAVIWVEDRAKASHRVSNAGGEIRVRLALPSQEATAAGDLVSYLRQQECTLWRLAAEKMGWPTPPEDVPA